MTSFRSTLKRVLAWADQSGRRKHGQTGCFGSEVLESFEIRHDDDAGHQRRRRKSCPADDGAARWRRRRPIWFFTAKDNDLVQQFGGNDRAIATFASRGHDLFAAVHGRLSVDTDRAVVDRLWNRFVAAWYEGGKDDPKLALLRLDPGLGLI